MTEKDFTKDIYLPIEGEMYKFIEEIAHETIKTINSECSITISFSEYKFVVTVFVNSNFFEKVLLHPRCKILNGQLPLFGDSLSINTPSYKKAILELDTITISYVCTSFYNGQPTCKLKKIFGD